MWHCYQSFLLVIVGVWFGLVETIRLALNLMIFLPQPREYWGYGVHYHARLDLRK